MNKINEIPGLSIEQQRMGEVIRDQLLLKASKKGTKIDGIVECYARGYWPYIAYYALDKDGELLGQVMVNVPDIMENIELIKGLKFEQKIIKHSNHIGVDINKYITDGIVKTNLEAQKMGKDLAEKTKIKYWVAYDDKDKTYWGKNCRVKKLSYAKTFESEKETIEFITSMVNNSQCKPKAIYEKDLKE